MKKSLPEIARGIEAGTDGIWRTRGCAPVCFPEDGNRICFAVEDSSFWFEHRKRCLLALLDRFPPPGTFFDIGGGNGYMSAAIQAAGHEVVLIEPGSEGAINAQKRGIGQIICGTLEDAGFLPETMPAIGLFDVLEHVQSDEEFLDECCKRQSAGGRIYITVPAFRLLWSGEDELAGHHRRYDLKQLAFLLRSTGYAVEFASYFFGFLLLPVLACRAIPYRLGWRPKQETEANVRSDHVIESRVTHALLAACRNREVGRLERLQPIRRGTSLVVVARKLPGRAMTTGSHVCA